MEIENDLKKLIHQLVHKNVGQISVNGSEITVHVYEQESKISLFTPVYHGGNYIPKSVRNCLLDQMPFPQQMIKTYLSLDEPNFRVNLNYQGNLEHFDRGSFKDLLEEFSWIAEEWRYFLDEHDKNDLIYIHAR